MAPRTSSTHRPVRRLDKSLWIASAFLLSALLSTVASALPNPTRSGPATTDPAGFLDVAGLAPNATPYCDSPTYFDFWTLGSDADGGVAGSTDTGPGGVTLTLTDRPGVGGGLRVTAPDHGVIFDDADDGTVTLDQPMFYTQWVFVDIDLSSEGFAATGCVGGDTQCVGGTSPPGVAVMAQNTSFAGGMVSTDQATGFASYQIGPGARLGPTTIDSRMQIDFLGAVDTLFLDKIGTGGAGFAVGGGCQPIGVAKAAGEPMANGFGGFVIPFTIRVFNNLPDAATLGSVLAAAEAASSAGQFSGPPTPVEIPIQSLQVTDDLATVFGAGTFTVTNLSTGTLTANPAGFDGAAEPQILAGTDALAPGEIAVITFDVVFTPPADTVYPLLLSNQVVASGVAQGVPVSDASDDGSEPGPGDDNGDGGTDDPTPIMISAAPTTVPPVDVPIGPFGLAALALGLLVVGVAALRR